MRPTILQKAADRKQSTGKAAGRVTPVQYRLAVVASVVERMTHTTCEAWKVENRAEQKRQWESRAPQVTQVRMQETLEHSGAKGTLEKDNCPYPPCGQWR